MKYEPTTITELTAVEGNTIGIVEVPDTEFQSKINLLTILLNTQEGEVVMDREFGIKLTSQSFELYNFQNTEAFEFQLIEMFREKARKYVPEFDLSDLEAYIESNFTGPNGTIIVKALWVYRNKWKFNTLSVVKPNNKFGTVSSNVELYEDKSQEPKDVITKKTMLNVTNEIKRQLATKEFEQGTF